MKKGSSKEKKCNRDNKMIVLMIICVVLSLITLAIVAYDKLIKNDGNCGNGSACVSYLK